MPEWVYLTAVVAVTGIITLGLRAFPFLLFGGRPLPGWVNYLGRVLPPAIMTVLVIYCLKDTSFSAPSFGLPELIASVLVVVLHSLKRNMYLSIAAGTLCYMLLSRLL